MRYFSEDHEELSKSEIIGLEVNLVWNEMPVLMPASLAELTKKLQRPCGDGEDAFTLFTLSPVDPPMGLWCQIHGHVKEGQLTYFQMNLDRKPKKNPPETIVKISKEIGEYPGGLLRILEGIGGRTYPCEAAARFVFKKSPFDIVPRQIGNEFSPFKWAGEQLKLRTEDGKTAEISVLADDGAMAQIECKFDLAIQVESFEFAAEKLREELTPLLRKK